MVQSRREADLALESFARQPGIEVEVQDLEGHHAVMPHVVGEIDSSHASLTDLAIDPVPAGEGFVEEVEQDVKLAVRAVVADRADRFPTAMTAMTAMTAPGSVRAAHNLRTSAASPASPAAQSG